MTSPSPTPHLFLLSLFDREQWCPVLQARFAVTDRLRLCDLLGATEEAELDQKIFYLNDAEALKLCEAFGISLDWAALDFPDREFIVDRIPSIQQAPYLIHTGYELPLLLDGRKKLARFIEPYPPMSFEGEERFDHWVAAGLLHKEVELEPSGNERTQAGGRQGTRHVYFTAKGEEWRIPAMKMVWRAGGWNEHFERLEGMLFWQNDWWIERGLRGGGFGGMPHCCAVTNEGLAWIKQAGYRALPPIAEPELVLDDYGPQRSIDEQMSRLERADAAALAVFSVDWRAFALWGTEVGPRRLLASRIPELNQLLLRPITIQLVQANPEG
ncbi:protein of unknown function [Bradyrhizobium sp. ORS 285]|uniref:hypothetical protein n=1 Tax=Bradyrhizobium sp. ORS 285 TaxID=115808 RepID=UPI0002405C79|nr:hypothetical protein [Bradyrhizobium sp. ORS 285]CCD88329.1 hypothetical protein BRAO285_320039 [Bradyrhizobium sp. ORS 285]SMX55452.1 protein of unknown function [Bradyrhizobium sp. ORS 285]